jgi:hypothetical protein
MRMLADQAETNVARAVHDADLPGAVTEYEIEQDATDEEGRWHVFFVPYYSCGSCSGYTADEVVGQYKDLISQLTRRSAFLTIFGLFEHRIAGCLDVMDRITGQPEVTKFQTVEHCHRRLKERLGDTGIIDVEHLAVIRNIMAHGDGVAVNYHELVKPNVKRTDYEKRLVKGVERAVNYNTGITINARNVLSMDAHFLDYAVGEFARYVTGVDAAIRRYQKQNSTSSAGTRQRRKA